MYEKGVSAIIATILLLMITIGLAGTAYIYMSGILTGKTRKTISVLDASCNGTDITLVVSNDGTDSVSISDDLNFLVQNSEVTFSATGGETEIPPHDVVAFTASDTSITSGSNTVLVVSPSNSVRQVVYC